MLSVSRCEGGGVQVRAETPPQRQEQFQVSSIVPPLSQKRTTEALKRTYKKEISVVLAPPLLCVAPPTPVFYLRLHCTTKSCILIGCCDCLSNLDHTSSDGAATLTALALWWSSSPWSILPPSPSSQGNRFSIIQICKVVFILWMVL